MSDSPEGFGRNNAGPEQTRPAWPKALAVVIVVLFLVVALVFGVGVLIGE